MRDADRERGDDESAGPTAEDDAGAGSAGASARDRHAQALIRKHAAYATASGAIPLAIADVAAVSAVQLDLVKALCEVYEVDFSTAQSKALISTLTSSILARVGAASLVKLIPVAGTLVGSVAAGVLAGASTFALGQAFAVHLRRGGSVGDLDPERLKQVYREQFERGKAFIREWQARRASGAEPAADGFDLDAMQRTRPGAAVSEEPAPDPDRRTPPANGEAPGGEPKSLTARLAELEQLRELGLVSAREYEHTRQRLLDQL